MIQMAFYYKSAILIYLWDLSSLLCARGENDVIYGSL